jgi:hypothetical protein
LSFLANLIRNKKYPTTATFFCQIKNNAVFHEYMFAHERIIIVVWLRAIYFWHSEIWVNIIGFALRIQMHVWISWIASVSLCKIVRSSIILLLPLLWERLEFQYW